MKFFLNIKGVSKKKIIKREYRTEDLELFPNDGKVSVRDFLIAMVKSEKRRLDKKMQSEDKFQEVFPVNAQSTEKAIEHALQGFTDGLIAFFVDGKKYESLEDIIILREGSEVTLIRLTFLAGRMW